MRGIVFALTARELLLSERTVRSLRGAGLGAVETLLGNAAVSAQLAAAEMPYLLVQAGAWLEARRLQPIPPSATGRPLVALGRGERVAYLEPAAARALGSLLRRSPWEEALASLTAREAFRTVHLPDLAHGYDPALRVLQLVTTIQLGGAERVTLDLAEELPRRGVRVRVAALGRSRRTEHPEPRGFLVRPAPAVAELVGREHFDLVHGHLLSATDCAALTAASIPLVLTVHNMPAGWPRGFAETGARADLLLACSQAVRATLQEAALPEPSRTVWNGIEAGRFAPTAARQSRGAEWRHAAGWGAEDFVVIAVANPRRQKRLERIPEILAQLQALMPARRVRAIFAGEVNRKNASDLAAHAALEAEIERHALRESVRQLPGATEIPTLLAASDAFLSTSDYEGLSLAQLEALAAGLPVICTSVGGAPEIAREMHSAASYYRALPVEASPADFARALAEAPAAPRGSRLPAAFHRSRMAARTEQMYRAALALRLRRPLAPAGVWLVTNNFSMGGAQSSARRLLTHWSREGRRVRAFTVQEETPSRGTLALREQGIPVDTLADALLEFLARAAVEPPQAVLFWNLLPSCKILLTDALPGIRCFDVSPGEMNFHSLADYFSKPRAELPYRTAREYGAELAGAVVKFHAERARAERELGCPVTVIPNGVETPLPHLRPPNARLIFGTAARLSPDKRLEDLLAAFTLAHPGLPLYELHLAGRLEQGAADYVARLREQGAALPLVWRGELPGSAEFLRELDIFVMISEPAGCPNASLEAMAAGLPVIATDAGGAAEQVLDRVTGRLTPRRDPAAFAAALLELAHDPPARARHGAAGRRRAETHFSLHAMAAAYARLCALAPLPARGDSLPETVDTPAAPATVAPLFASTRFL